MELEGAREDGGEHLNRGWGKEVVKKNCLVFTEGLLCVSHSSKHFTFIMLFNLQNNAISQILFSFPFL